MLKSQNGARAPKDMPPMRPGSRPRVLIVDDSAVARAVIGRMVDASGRFAVAEAFADARAAQAYLATNRVDAILLDIEMPGVDGLTALPDLLSAGRGAHVIIVSSSAKDGAASTIQALALGASDTLVKPSAGRLGGQFAGTLIEKLDRLLDPADEARNGTAGRACRAAAASMPEAFALVAIGASTGGIHALSQLLRAIPASFRLPMLVTQHLPESFISYFAAQLAVLAGRPCEVAEDGALLRPGRIWVAPGHAHLEVARSASGARIRLSDSPSASGCCPSVDPMLASAAALYGERAMGIVLSGMGRDGCEGARALADAGGSVVAQDEATSTVWGMPGAVVRAGIARCVLPPDEIGRLVATRRQQP